MNSQEFEHFPLPSLLTRESADVIIYRWPVGAVELECESARASRVRGSFAFQATRCVLTRTQSSLPLSGRSCIAIRDTIPVKTVRLPFGGASSAPPVGELFSPTRPCLPARPQSLR